MSKPKGNVELLPEWKPRFLRLRVHAELEHQMELCRDGVEDAIVIGPRGAGKTFAIQHFLDAFEAEELQRSPAKGVEPRGHKYYATSCSTGRKTALVDLIEVTAGPLSAGAKRAMTPRSLIAMAVEEIRLQGIRLIVIDEAQMISPPNLDQIRQVPDEARRQGYAMGLLLVGNEELRDSLVEIRQAGQRFSSEVVFPRFQPASVAPYLTEFHPHLPLLRAEIGEKRWRVLEEEIFRAVGGAFRRLTVLLTNANVLSVRLQRPIDEEIIRLAISKLARES